MSLIAGVIALYVKKIGNRRLRDYLAIFCVGATLVAMVRLAEELERQEQKQTFDDFLAKQPERLAKNSAPANGREEGTEAKEARELVAREIGANPLGVSGNDLKVRRNPNGQGVFVYVFPPPTDATGAKRHLMWFVLYQLGYTINGSTKNLTPDFPWPREAPSEEWAKTGISHLATQEVIEFLYDGRQLLTDKPPPKVELDIPETEVTCEDLIQITRTLGSAIQELRTSPNLTKQVVEMRAKFEGVELSIPERCERKFEQLCELLWAVSGGLVSVAELVKLRGQDATSVRIQVETQAEDFEKKLKPELASKCE